MDTAPPAPPSHTKQVPSTPYIPLDTFASAFSFLDGKSLLVCATVCSSWEEVQFHSESSNAHTHTLTSIHYRFWIFHNPNLPFLLL
jgi:hypothetical protein